MDSACDPTMKYIAQILKDSPCFHVQVDDHTDNVGNTESNRKLSQERAEAVVKYLAERRIAADGKEKGRHKINELRVN